MSSLFQQVCAASPSPQRAGSATLSGASQWAQGDSETVKRQAQQREGLSQASCQACLAGIHLHRPREAGKGAGEGPDVLKVKPRICNSCILHCQSKYSDMWLENHGHFTVPLWWLKKEGHTHQWTDHGTERFQEWTEITVLASQSEGSLF